MNNITTIVAIWILTGVLSLPGEIKSKGADFPYVQTTSGNERNKNGFLNVKDFGAAGNGIADDTEPIQDAIDAAGNGTVFIPSGTYLVGSLTIKYATNIIGSGWSDRFKEGGSVLKSVSPLPVIQITNTSPLQYSDGASIKDLHIFGNAPSNKAPSKQTGIYISTEGPVLIERVFISNCGDYGIRLGNFTHTTCIEISKCRIFQNAKGGIYGRYSDKAQINAIHISNCEIDQNGYGINLLGTNIIIRDNVIQGNDSSGIFMSARDLSVNCSSTQTLIDGNYFEANGGGEIFIEEYYKSLPEVIQYHFNIEISNNYFLTIRRRLSKPGANASITIRKASGSELVYGISDLHIRNNNRFMSNGGSAWIDGGNVLNNSCIIEIPATPAPTSVVKNVLNGSVVIDGVTSLSTAYPSSAITAKTGIVSRDLHPTLQLTMDEPVNITASPQIAEGFIGQTIRIIGNSDKNVLTLEDGNGLQLAGSKSFVLGNNDIITLIYTRSGWTEISRSDN